MTEEANGIDPEQIPCSAATLGLHCFPGLFIPVPRVISSMVSEESLRFIDVIVLDKVLFFSEKCLALHQIRRVSENIFSYFSMKTYVVGTH